MSKLSRTLIADKLKSAAKMAIRSDDKHLAVCVLNTATIYLYGRDDILKLVEKSTISGLRIAEEEKHSRRGVTPARNLDGDNVDDALDAAVEYATLADEEHLAGIISFAHSLRSVGRADLIKQLYDVAESLSSPAVGRKPQKEIIIFENPDDNGVA